MMDEQFEHLELSSKKYQELKNIVIKAERRLLNVLGFVVHVHHPHKLIYIYLHILCQLKNDPKKHTVSEIRKSRQLLQKAWSYMNDGLRTDMFLRYTPETIACACIQLAVRTVEEPIVLPTEPFAWFELFDASDRDVRAISQTIWELYTRTQAPSLKMVSDLCLRCAQPHSQTQISNKELGVQMSLELAPKIVELLPSSSSVLSSSLSLAAAAAQQSADGGGPAPKKRSRFSEANVERLKNYATKIAVDRQQRRDRERDRDRGSSGGGRDGRDRRRRDDRGGGDDHFYHDRR